MLTGGELVVRRDLRIDGDADNGGTEVTLSGGDAQRLLRSSGAGTDLALQDLALADGRVDGDRDGGGVFVGTGTSVALTGCTVRGCESGYQDGHGGGIFAESGSRSTVAGSAILGNLSGYSGGGIATGGNVALVVRNSRLADNSASVHGSGGAIDLGGNSSLTIEGSSLSGNGAYFDGALAMSSGSTATIARSMISDNHASRGGGIGGYGSRVTLTDSTIAGNSIVAGNASVEIAGSITLSNGHNVFGTDVEGSIAGDRENVAPGALFAVIDPDTAAGS